MFVRDYSDVVKVAFIVFNGHLADVDLLGVRFSLLCLLLGLLLIGLKGFSFGLGLGGLHLGDGFSLSSLGGSLLLLFFSLRFFSGSFLLFVVFSIVLLASLCFNVTNEVGEKCFHLLVSFSIEHARVLVESIVLGAVPVEEEFSIKELSVVESLTEGGGLLLHGGKG